MIIIMTQTKPNFFLDLIFILVFTVIVSQNEYLENCVFTERKKKSTWKLTWGFKKILLSPWFNSYLGAIFISSLNGFYTISNQKLFWNFFLLLQ